jgi:hypothetical protein
MLLLIGLSGFFSYGLYDKTFMDAIEQHVLDTNAGKQLS